MPKSKKASGMTSPPHVRASNDAFGKTSPHWNLPFHVGNITAAEILAYCPHWLKSVDVIDRFVVNGGKAKVIANMLNRFRNLPSDDGIIPTNSICVMMQCAMRAFGLKDWTMGKHSQIDENHVWDSASLDVSNFRTPHITHPKKGSKKVENVPAAPIQFRDLAHGVKEHPSDSDALDLTRCVLYAIDNPDESWRFPIDFADLVNHLGGPQTPTHFHPDNRAFERHLAEVDSLAPLKKVSVAPLAKRVRFDTTNKIATTQNSDMRLTSPRKRGYEEFNSLQSDTMKTSGKRRSGRLATQGLKDLRESDSDAGTPYKNIDGYEPPQKKRKSARASSVESEFTGNYTSDSESLPDAKEDISDDYLNPKPKRPVRASAQKGRRLTQKAIHKETPKTHFTAMRTEATTPFVGAAPMYTMHNAYAIPTTHNAYAMPTTHNAYAMPTTQNAFAMPTTHNAYAMPTTHNAYSMPTMHTAFATPTMHTAFTEPATATVPDFLIDPVLLAYSRDLESRAPVSVKAPAADRDRLMVDEYNVWLFAEEGCTSREQMWASALSSKRFNGPRNVAPFRELYRLSNPELDDISDWAENVRWAKEQWLHFGIDTWTEYDFHLEQITQWRREHMWWSEEAIRFGARSQY
ncbi:uncharacterized protein N0V89_005338 [Didymosphaeria variabile]|uniref:Uncharacterized protein n=1 Tax=Didymosphaeria variabile TaxID=1932322 RepID=A0A9W8XM19_9PLEO|nr:uncharacterized protein N0V89_005338 [Didymosphaeria variabile]KAJ4353608.1 hypothetical protein N0V89_005338 [Didymosphaeria variabile]